MDYFSAIGIEACLTVFMSFAVLEPLANILHPEDSKKYFWRYFWIRIVILLICNMISTKFVAFDALVLFTGLIILPLVKKYVANKKNPIKNNNSTVSNSKESDINVHDSRTALTEEEKEKLKEKILERFKASGMDEEAVKEKYKKVTEYLDSIKNSQGRYSNLTANPNNNEYDNSKTNEVLTYIPDLSKWYSDYETDTKYDEFFTNTNYSTINNLMDKYVETKINNKNALHPKNIKQRAIAKIIFSIITFLICSYICLYHENIIVCSVIEIIALYLYCRSMRRMNLVNYIKKEIMARPDDNIDYIIESVKQQVVINRISISSFLLPLTIVLCCLIFLKPHIIYEKNDTGYSVRYYTLAIMYDSKVEIPDEYKGEKVNEIRGKTFYNMFMIKEVKLPKYITEIRGNTFENSGLERIEIPEGVTRIGGHAFYGCKNLSNVTIPDSLQAIGSSAFRRCYSLMHIRIPSRTNVNARAFKESPTKVERYEVDE